MTNPFYEGAPTSPEVMSAAGLIKSESSIWTCVQNNNNNQYYISLVDGTYNNTNKNNTNRVLLVESEKVVDIVFEAEMDCWSNKHASWDANKYHYHIGRIWRLIENLRNNTYGIWKSICFIVTYPKPREIFAAHYQDRIAHHIIAPYMKYIAEAVHTANGDKSFGNRKGKSAWHAAVAVRQMMLRHPDGYVATFDVKSFFMSISKDAAWDVFQRYEAKYRPDGMNEGYRVFIMELIRMMVYNNPALNCDRRSPMEMWELIPEYKSLFHMDGMPIGNFYAQIIANLILEVVIEKLDGYDVAEFVDDFCAVFDTVNEFKEIKARFSSGLDELKLKANTNKVCIQPVRHGVKWCGYFIYQNRIYLSNRPIRNCMRKIDRYACNVSLESARDIQTMVNSYIGMLCHCAEYKTQKKICRKVLDCGFGKYVYFKNYGNRLVCKIKKQYKRRNISINTIKIINSYVSDYASTQRVKTL